MVRTKLRIARLSWVRYFFRKWIGGRVVDAFTGRKREAYERATDQLGEGKVIGGGHLMFKKNSACLKKSQVIQNLHDPCGHLMFKKILHVFFTMSFSSHVFSTMIWRPMI